MAPLTTPAALTALTAPPGGRRHLSLSPSRAADFKACPLRYRFRVIDRLPEPLSAAAVRGTLIHAVLEKLFDVPAGGRTIQVATDLLAPTWSQLCVEEPELAELFTSSASEERSDTATVLEAPDVKLEESAWLASGAALLQRYFSLEDPNRIEPAGREQQVTVSLPGGLELRGIIDRLDIAPSGAIRVVDYKTGRAPAEAWEAKALFQLKFYALVLWRMNGVVPAMLQLLYLADEQRLTYSPTADELVAFERQVQSLWKAIDTAQQSGDFRASKGPLCRFCSHQDLCPEFGGTTPPYPISSVVPST